MELTYYKDFTFRPKHEAGYSANATLNFCPMEYFPFKLLTRTKGCDTLKVLLLLLLLLLCTNFNIQVDKDLISVSKYVQLNNTLIYSNLRFICNH
jgi:hypothetical protein